MKIRIALSVCFRVLILCALILVQSCSSKQLDKPFNLELRSSWPVPTIPENNPLTEESVKLGKQLFFDSQLSIDSTISCASCHKPEFGFADGVSKSFGVENRIGFRNSGTLTNVAYLPYFNRDGGVKTLDLFSSLPIEDHDEMGFNLLALGKRLKQNYSYNKLSQTAYKRDIDGFVITRALASFLRTFISDQSAFDKFYYDGNQEALSAIQIQGMELFFGKAQCDICHSGTNFSDYSFQNNGLYDTYTNDPGRERITLDSTDQGKFRVASLRNIEFTGPYMHDGSIQTLAEVIEHYNSGGSLHPNKNPILNQINLSPEEKESLLAFLESLTDKAFLENPAFTKLNR